MPIKPRTKIPEIFLGAFLTVSVFSMGMMFESSRRGSSESKSQALSEPVGHMQSGGFWNWITHDAAGFFTLCLVAVGLGQAGLFVWQLRIMRDGIVDARIAAEAAKASAETAREQVAVTKMGVIDLERAYLAIGPTQIMTGFISGRQKNPSFYAEGDPLEVTAKLFIHNTGRTAATIKRIYGEFSNILPIGDRPVYENVDPVLTDLSIPADAKDVLSPFSFKSEYLGEQFFWGYIEYLDIFKNKRTSRFCAAIFPARKSQSPSGESIYGKYQLAGSDAWRECD